MATSTRITINATVNTTKTVETLKSAIAHKLSANETLRPIIPYHPDTGWIGVFNIANNTEGLLADARHQNLSTNLENEESPEFINLKQTIRRVARG